MTLADQPAFAELQSSASGQGQPSVMRIEASSPLPSWPLALMITAYPLWFLLGVSGFMWVATAAIMLIFLVQRRDVVAPKGTFLYGIFLVGVLGSAFSIDTVPRLAGYTLRVGYYVSAGIMLLYCLNGGRGVDVWRIARAFAYWWLATIAGGYLAFFLGEFTYLSPMGYLLPASLKANELVKTMVTPGFADIQSIVGFPVPRPKAPFSYTNSWGAMLGLLTPFGLMAASDARVGISQKLARVGLLLSVVPGVVSLNRGLWLSLGLGLLYAGFRFGLSGKTKLLGQMFIGGLVLSVILIFSPLNDLVSARVNNESPSDATRSSLILGAIEGASERPVFGWGAPRPNPNPKHPPIGTHGQLWSLSFSHGLVGLIGYMGAMFSFLFWARKQVTRVGVWAHTVILIGIIQTPFYLQVPHQLFTIFAAVAIAIRLQQDPTGANEELVVS